MFDRPIPEILIESYHEAVNSAKPEHCLPPFLPDPPDDGEGKTYVLAAGKAAAEMSRVFEDHYNAPYEGLAITRYGHGAPTSRIKVVEAAHPVPDGKGAEAVQEMLGIAGRAREGDLVICLLSGGGSALLSLPVDGLAIEDISAVTRTLLLSGADIAEINAVRKHLNKALGGALAAAAHPARLVTLAISDVVGDDPAVIASGPTVADPSTMQDVRDILRRYDAALSPALEQVLARDDLETPKPGDAVFDCAQYHLIATPQKALEAAAKYFTALGIESLILGDHYDGETNECALAHVTKVQELLRSPRASLPLAVISGGETTVKVGGDGDGGPNAQFMLAAAIALAGEARVFALAGDTDGIDGSRDSAGAWITPDTLADARKCGINAQEYLQRNDSYAFFKEVGTLLVPGPTHTNVNDYRAFLLLPE